MLEEMMAHDFGLAPLPLGGMLSDCPAPDWLELAGEGGARAVSVTGGGDPKMEPIRKFHTERNGASNIHTNPRRPDPLLLPEVPPELPCRGKTMLSPSHGGDSDGIDKPPLKLFCQVKQ